MLEPIDFETSFALCTAIATTSYAGFPARIKSTIIDVYDNESIDIGQCVSVRFSPVTVSVMPAIERQRGVCCEITVPISPAVARRASGWIKAISDPTRLSMLATLYSAQAPVCICDFTAAYQLSQPTISHHMAKLRRARLVAAHKRGLWIYYTVAIPLPLPIVNVLEAVLAKPVDQHARRAQQRQTA